MARWQIMKDGAPTSDDIFDDTNIAQPGDVEFSTDAITTHVATLGGAKANGFNYVGLSEHLT